MPKIPKSKNRNGFTLIESLISVMILGVTLVALLASFMMGRMNAAVAKHNIEAMNHAQAAMEQYLNNGSTTYALSGGDIVSLGGACDFSVTSYATGVNEVVVTISWEESAMGGREQECQLVTLVRQ